MRSVVRPSVWAFLGIQAFLYACFLFLDIARAGEGSLWIKYLSIVLCLVFSIGWSRRGGEILVTAALALTVGADTFLLVIDGYYILGLMLFCGVQGLYLLRLEKETGERARWTARLGLYLAGLPVLMYAELLTPLNSVALFYLIHFVCNALWSRRLKGVRGQMFSIGLVLFLCCDLCVGMFNLPRLVPRGLFLLARIGMWLFYLPAQVLITLSGLPDVFTGGTRE